MKLKQPFEIPGKSFLTNPDFLMSSREEEKLRKAHKDLANAIQQIYLCAIPHLQKLNETFRKLGKMAVKLRNLETEKLPRKQKKAFIRQYGRQAYHKKYNKGRFIIEHHTPDRMAGKQNGLSHDYTYTD